ncbi:TlpA disulfide reductase family protein [Sandarakinorhabdus sp.]|uniref:peroxiredoxin family protein n=1 Tax=Sandarakinorhabdus sp. TaxID=1916663 RepID=UPI00286DC6A5|nr:TlpA disulfide reductase family protein [Sandarakinorhabdus sp.]
MIFRLAARLTALLAIGLGAAIAVAAPAGPYGVWRVSFDQHPGGPVPFTLELRAGKTGPVAVLVNAPERVRAEQVSVAGETVTLTFPSYNSRLVLTHGSDDRLTGAATVLRSVGTVTLPATGVRGNWRFSPQPASAAGNVSGRWVVEYGDGKVRGIANLKQVGSLVSGSVQLPSGDMRYLSGELSGKQLRLSTFDGSFTNLWTATLDGGALRGAQFAATSRPAGTAWTARREKNADMAAVAVEKPGGERLSFRLPDGTGGFVSLSDARYKGKVVVISIGGAWCPNCHDEAMYLGPYASRRRAEGLEMIGLQFEYGTDQARAFRQMASFKSRYKLPYPMVYGGQPVPEDTIKVLGALGPVKVYPSTIFIGRDGLVKEVHVGWSGPATGALNVKAKREFDETVSRLLKQRA